MYIANTGAWVDSGNRVFEAENAYYLKYNIEKAIFALNMILEQKPDFNIFSNNIVYYHTFLDLLIEALGQISSRFNKNNKKYKTDEKYKDVINLNISNYDFTYDNYPNLSIRKVRNFVTHINEYNIDFINENSSVGGFNVIFNDSDVEFIDALKDKKKHNNTLDLRNNIYYVTSANGKEYKLFIKEVKIELTNLKERNDIIYGYVTDLY